MFANALRDNIKEKKLSFADIAKVVGERWKQISADEKFYWEDTAAKAKQEYLKQVAEYKKTDSYNVRVEFMKENQKKKKQRNNSSFCLGLHFLVFSSFLTALSRVSSPI